MVLTVRAPVTATPSLAAIGPACVVVAPEVPMVVSVACDASILMLPAALSVRPVPPVTQTVPVASGNVMVRSAVGSVMVSVVS